MARRRNALPGFGLSLGVTLTYLGFLVVIPISMVFIKTTSMTWERFWGTISSDRAVASYYLSIGASLIAAVANVVFGTIVAWVLVRYRFFGRGIVDAMVDLPFALPSARSPRPRSAERTADRPSRRPGVGPESRSAPGPRRPVRRKRPRGMADIAK